MVDCHNGGFTGRLGERPLSVCRLSEKVTSLAPAAGRLSLRNAPKTCRSVICVVWVSGKSSASILGSVSLTAVAAVLESGSC